MVDLVLKQLAIIILLKLLILLPKGRSVYQKLSFKEGIPDGNIFFSLTHSHLLFNSINCHYAIFKPNNQNMLEIPSPLDSNINPTVKEKKFLNNTIFKIVHKLRVCIMAYMIFPFILNYFHNLDLATKGHL